MRDDNDTGEDVDDIARMAAAPALLGALRDITGMGFAAIARVTDTSWTACAVSDGADFGLVPGGALPIESMLCRGPLMRRGPIAISRASTDPACEDHRAPRAYGIESYVSAPIVLPNGDYFGNLCAADARPADVSRPEILGVFVRFADLVAAHVQAQREARAAREALAEERAASSLVEEFVSILSHDLRNPLNGIAA